MAKNDFIGLGDKKVTNVAPKGVPYSGNLNEGTPKHAKGIVHSDAPGVPLERPTAPAGAGNPPMIDFQDNIDATPNQPSPVTGGSGDTQRVMSKLVNKQPVSSDGKSGSER
jgi:hypothetical protein